MPNQQTLNPDREVEFWTPDGTKWRMREMNGEREAFFKTQYAKADGTVNWERLWYSRFSTTIIEPKFTQDFYSNLSERTLSLLRGHWEMLNGVTEADFLGSYKAPIRKDTSSQSAKPSTSDGVSTTISG